MENTFKELRKQKKLTQPELADKMNISKGYVSELENKNKTPSLKVYYKLKKILGEKIDEHFFN
jgi:transcriptional regulator with XRE-family HTH domain